MAVSYKKLFKLMIDRNLKKKDLKKMTGLSYTTIAKLEKSETVRSDVLDKICCGLGCQLNDIITMNCRKRKLPDVMKRYEISEEIICTNSAGRSQTVMMQLRWKISI